MLKNYLLLAVKNFRKHKLFSLINILGLTVGETMYVSYLSPPYAPALLNDYPEAIQKAVRVFPDNDLVTYNGISFNEKKIVLVDSNFFEFFSFRLLKGNAAS